MQTQSHNYVHYLSTICIIHTYVCTYLHVATYIELVCNFLILVYKTYIQTNFRRPASYVPLMALFVDPELPL